MKPAGEKITCLTSYDASFTTLLENNGVEILLVGDSLGMVVQGHASTLPVSMENMLYHCQLVARARRRAWLIVDMPYQSYETPQQTVANAKQLIEQGGADMVKLEGGREQIDKVSALSEAGIPICGHIGLLPQSVEKLGGFRVQGREVEDAAGIVEDAVTLQQAGAGLLVLECVPAALGRRVSEAVTIPVIGIGAGKDCDGQVLVVYDLIGLSAGRRPRFVRDFLTRTGTLDKAVAAFVQAVKEGSFPSDTESYE